MSVKHGMLALLAQEPMGVYRLRKEFEARTGGAWPVNIGQIYSTMQRLERDGLVACLKEPDADVERYALTDAGRTAAQEWWTTPVERTPNGRDELVIKLALAVGADGVDVPAIVQAQRSQTLRSMRDLARLKAQVPGPGQPISRPELAWSLVLDHHTYTAEAEVRWLDHLEATMTAARITPSATPGGEASDAVVPTSTEAKDR